MRRKMNRLYVIVLTIISGLILSSCGSSEKTETDVKKEEVKKVEEIKTPPPVEEKFDISDRGLFPNATLSFDLKDTDAYSDPVVGDFIKIKKGSKFLAVFHEFKYDKQTNEKDTEIIFAFELPSLEKGTKLYPEKFIYYLLSYSINKSRIDGKAIHGYLTFKDISEFYATGYFDFNIEGNKKAFDQPDVSVDVNYKGSFKIPVRELK
jgi:hypothetical protein